MLAQVLGTLFRLMETHEAAWQGVQGSRDVPLVGFPFSVGLEPVPVNLAAMVGHFRRGVKDLTPIWSAVFSAEDMQRLSAAAPSPGERCEIEDALWVRLVYDLAAAFHHRVMDREHLLRASLPLYMGRVASFIREVADLDALAVEERLERLCVAFEEQKPYLQQRWQRARRARRHDGGPSTS